MLTYSDDPTFRLELVVADGQRAASGRPARRAGAGTVLARGPGRGADGARRPVRRRPDGRRSPDPSRSGSAARTVLAARARPVRARAATRPRRAGSGSSGSRSATRPTGRRRAPSAPAASAACSRTSASSGRTASGSTPRASGTPFRRDARRPPRPDSGGAAGCRGCLFEETAAVGNNWKGHDQVWEAGGGKWAGTPDSVIRRHYAAHNDGPGIWLDGDNHRNTIEGCLLVGNRGAGVMLELNTTETLVQHNRDRPDAAGSTGPGAGVLSQAASAQRATSTTPSSRTRASGVWLRLDPERRAADGHNVVANNWIVGNVTGEPRGAARCRSTGTEPGARPHDAVRGQRLRAAAGDGLYQSTFFVYPRPSGAADFRSDDLDAWRRLVGGDRTARW